jgi:hypothetical protein
MSDVVDLKLKLYLFLSSKVPRSTQLLMQGKIIGLSYLEGRVDPLSGTHRWKWGLSMIYKPPKPSLS